MKYVAVIFLCLLGLVELVIRGVITLVTLFGTIFMVDDFFDCYCFNLADEIVRSR